MSFVVKPAYGFRSQRACVISLNRIYTLYHPEAYIACPSFIAQYKNLYQYFNVTPSMNFIATFQDIFLLWNITILKKYHNSY